MRTDRVLSMLGIARRAGKLDAGFDLACERIAYEKAKLAVAAADISEKTFKNLKFEADKMNVPCRRLETNMKETGKACGIKAGIAVVTDEGLANAVLKLIDEPEEGGERV